MIPQAVVDASVVVKIYLREEHSEAAELCLRGAERLVAPDLIWTEAANVVWKRFRRLELTRDAALENLRRITELPVSTTPSDELLPAALTLAMQHDRTVYDSLYLALALKLGAPFFTADQRLVGAMAGTALEPHVRWIGSAG